MGKRALFIRLQGCDQACPWCDAAGTWHPAFKTTHKAMTAGELASLAEARMGRRERTIIVVTGGEPALYDLLPLFYALDPLQVPIHIETAGHKPIPEFGLWITLSPKPFAARPLPENVERANEFKIIVAEPGDIDRGLDCIAGRRSLSPVWLHPEWSQRDNPEVLGAILDAVVNRPSENLRAGWQVHKLYAADQASPHSDKRLIPLGGVGGLSR